MKYYYPYTHNVNTFSVKGIFFASKQLWGKGQRQKHCLHIREFLFYLFYWKQNETANIIQYLTEMDCLLGKKTQDHKNKTKLNDWFSEWTH